METIGADLRQIQRTPLAAPHVAALREVGTVVTYPAGAFLALPGHPADRFTYVEDGEIKVVNPYTDERHLSSTLGPAQFMGEISFLNVGSWSLAMRINDKWKFVEALTLSASPDACTGRHLVASEAHQKNERGWPSDGASKVARLDDRWFGSLYKTSTRCHR